MTLTTRNLSDHDIVNADIQHAQFKPRHRNRSDLKDQAGAARGDQRIHTLTPHLDETDAHAQRTRDRLAEFDPALVAAIGAAVAQDLAFFAGVFDVA